MWTFGYIASNVINAVKSLRFYVGNENDPSTAVHDAAVEENVADSGEESEDEWNYFKGNSAAAETSASSLKTDQEVAELTKTIEEEQDMSQLNPNAAEFVPISSPTRNISSPACRALVDDIVLAQSPRSNNRNTAIDINVPNPLEFACEVKNRPCDILNDSHDNENGHKLSSQEVMENLLNGKNLDEIEFYPSTPSKTASHPNPDEFHFGPNATPFSTPAKPMDQSEAALSTRALFGDESTASYLDGKTLESTALMESSDEREDSVSSLKLKEQDPMSMSFYQDENEHNPFDLNRVQPIPDDLDEFIAGTNEEGQDKENLNPEFNNQYLGVSQLPKTPEPEVCDLPPAISPSLAEIAKQPLPITPEPTESESEGDKLESLTTDIDEPFHKEQNQNEDESDFVNSSTSNLLPPTTELSSVENNPTACDIKKMQDLDSAPETEEYSQISDTADEIPPLCKSPEMTSDLDQFDSDIREVIQEASQIIDRVNKIEDIIDNVAETAEKIANPQENTTDLLNAINDDVEKTKDNVADDQITSAPVEIDDGKKEDECLHGEPDIVTNVVTYDNIAPLEKMEMNVSEKDDNVFDNTKCSEDLFGTSMEEAPKGFGSEFESKVDQEKTNLEAFVLTPEPSNEILKQNDEFDFEGGVAFKKTEDSYEEQVCEEKMYGNKMFENKMFEDKMFEGKMFEDKIFVDKTFEDKMFEDKTYEDKTYDDKYEDKISDDLRDLDSPMEDTTTSIKDDVSTSEIIEEAKDISTEKDILQDNFELNNEANIDRIGVVSEVPSDDQHISDFSLGVVGEKIDERLEEKIVEDIGEKVVDFMKEVEEKVIEDVDVKEMGDAIEKPEEKISDIVIEHIKEIEEPIISEQSSKEMSAESSDLSVVENQVSQLEPLIENDNLSQEITTELNTTELNTTELNTTELITTELIKTDLITPQYPEETTIITPSEEIRDVVPKYQPLEVEEIPQEEIKLDLPPVEGIKEDQIKPANIEEIKADIPAPQEEIKPEITSPQEEIKPEITSPQEEIKPEITSPQEEIKPEITPPQEEIKSEIKSEIASLQEEIKAELPEKEEIKLELPEKEEIKTEILPQTEIKPDLPEKEKIQIVTTAVIGASASAVAAAIAATAKSREKKPLEKKASPTKKPSTLKPTSSVPPKSSTSKPIAKPSAAKPLSSPTKTASPKPSTAKPAPAKPSTPSRTASRPSSAKSTPITDLAKGVEKKASPLTNGDVNKASPKVKMASKKTNVAARTPTASPRAPLTKTSPTKVEPKIEVIKAAPKPASRPLTATKTTNVTARPRPTTLASGAVSGTTKTATTTKPAVSKTATATSPKLSSGGLPKSRPTSAAATTKPRTTTATNVKPKTPDSEKQLKDTVNKQLTTTRTTVTKTAASAQPRANATATNKRTENKTSATSRTTTTTTKSTVTKTTKKPAEITKLANKAKPTTKSTSGSKPQQNGTTEQQHVVTTVVQETTTILTAEPQLVKDLSPIENKFIIDNSQVAETNVD